MDRENYLWICGNNELRRFDIESESLEIIKKCFETTGFCEDRSGRTWIASTRGLYLFDRKQQTLKRYLNEPGNSNNLHDQNICSILEDESGNIWIRTYDGIYCYDQDLQLKFHWEHTHVYTYTFPFRFLLRPLMEDNIGTIWFYSQDGIHQITKKTRKKCSSLQLI